MGAIPHGHFSDRNMTSYILHYITNKTLCLLSKVPFLETQLDCFIITLPKELIRNEGHFTFKSVALKSSYNE